MAEATGLRNNVLPYPIYGVPYTLVMPIMDADGDLVTGAADLDSEVSLNGDTGADCTNEATEIATNSGTYYLSLTAAEITANVVTGITKTSTAGAKTTTWALYPRVLPVLRSSTATAGAAGTITLDANAVAVDDFYNGCVVFVHTGTGAGQARVITDYAGATKVASVTPNFATNPANDSQFYIYLTDVACNAVAANLAAISGVSQSVADLKDFADSGYDPATHKVQGVVLTDTCTTNSDLVTAAAIKAAIEAAGSHLALILEDTGTTLPGTLANLALEATLTAMKGATFAEATDSLEALRNRGDAAWITADVSALALEATVAALNNISAADVQTQMEGVGSALATLLARLTATRAGYLDQLDAATAGKMAYYIAKMMIAIVNKAVTEEASGDTQQFDDAGLSLGTITALWDSDGVHTTRKRAVI